MITNYCESVAPSMIPADASENPLSSGVVRESNFPSNRAESVESSWSITVKNGVATLSGHIESAVELEGAEQLLAQLGGVDVVINLITPRYPL